MTWHSGSQRFERGLCPRNRFWGRPRRGPSRPPPIEDGGRSPPPRQLTAEVQTLDLWIRQQRGPRPFEAVPPELERVRAVGDGERARRVLLDQHQRVP